MLKLASQSQKLMVAHIKKNKQIANFGIIRLKIVLIMSKEKKKIPAESHARLAVCKEAKALFAWPRVESQRGVTLLQTKVYKL